MPDNRNFLIAIVLSVAILIGWQYFFAPNITPPQPEQQQTEQQQTGAAPSAIEGTLPSASDTTGTNGAATAPTSAVSTAAGTLTREAALARSPRVEIATRRLTGSINLRGARLDDLRLNDFRMTVDPSSPTIILLSPASGPNGYFAEYGWVGNADATGLPGPDTLWTVPDGARLTENSPVTLTYDNGAGLVFTREIAVDDEYMFSVTDGVTNATGAAVTLTPYGRIVRIGTPATSGYFILHEGLIGVFGDEGLEEVKYKNLTDEPPKAMPAVDRGWLGITDKYWATALIPPADMTFEGRFASFNEPTLLYQADYRSDSVSISDGDSVESLSRLFAGAKQVQVVDGYQNALNIERFELLIDWGWFYFITKPMFFAIDWFYRLFGNFGIAILAMTVCVKLAFFPLANKSYKSMSAMKKVQPQMQAIREQYKDDRAKQQQALMQLYKTEKINPLAGCWPIALQIPVFFALYKVLFVTIEMRQAPFFGWIRDLSAPDPTTVFNLFGLIPWDPPHLLMIGIWPLIMGVTMFVQMKLNPTPPDPTQAMIFTWMPVVFTFMLSSFPAGLVIYWAWNNTLSVTQQYVIMRRQGVDVDLIGNIISTFRKPPAGATSTPGKGASAKASSAKDASEAEKEKEAPSPDPVAEAEAKPARARAKTKAAPKTSSRRRPRRPATAKAKS